MTRVFFFVDPHSMRDTFASSSTGVSRRTTSDYEPPIADDHDAAITTRDGLTVGSSIDLPLKEGYTFVRVEFFWQGEKWTTRQKSNVPFVAEAIANIRGGIDAHMERFRANKESIVFDFYRYTDNTIGHFGPKRRELQTLFLLRLNPTTVGLMFHNPLPMQTVSLDLHSTTPWVLRDEPATPTLLAAIDAHMYPLPFHMVRNNVYKVKTVGNNLSPTHIQQWVQNCVVEWEGVDFALLSDECIDDMT